MTSLEGRKPISNDDTERLMKECEYSIEMREYLNEQAKRFRVDHEDGEKTTVIVMKSPPTDFE